MKRSAVGLGLCILTLASLAGCTPGSAVQANTSRHVGPVKGYAAPSFSLPSLQSGQSVSLQQYLGKGKVIVLNAWASWCGPCNDEASAFETLAQKYQTQVQFIGVNMTSTETDASQISTFVKKYGITYPVLLDKSETFMNDYHILGFPTTFILSPDGTILTVAPTSLSQSELEGYLQTAIQQSSRSPS